MMGAFYSEYFHQQIGHSVQLIEESPGRYRISVPFTFNDGDVLVIVLKQIGDQWVLSDEGHTICILPIVLRTLALNMVPGGR